MVSLSPYDAARRSAAVIDRNDYGRIALSGQDRTSFLQGLLTNDIAALGVGAGCYAAYLTPQGRMITDLWVYALADRILLTVALDVKDTLVTKLDQLIFSEDVQVADVTAELRSLALVGPDSARLVNTLLPNSSNQIDSLPDHGNASVPFDGGSAIVLRVTSIGEPGYEILVDATRFEALESAVADASVTKLDPAAAEALRIESGVPKFHVDMDEETIPLEAGIESRAVSFTKGCYVGQEVIVRVMHRGHGRIARRLVGLTCDGDVVPPRGAVVKSEEKGIGHVTSSVRSPALQQPIALAYLHREFSEPGSEVMLSGVRAVVTKLPFVSAR